MMDNLNKFIVDSSNIGQSYTSGDKTYTIEKIDNFSYTDPVDASVSKNQVKHKH
jgi:phosphoglucomutase